MGFVLFSSVSSKLVQFTICLCFAFFLFWTSFSCSNVLLSSKQVNFEVQALMGIKESLVDPHGVLDNWYADAVDPCSWTMVICSHQNLVIGLVTSSQSLSGILSPSIGNLTNLEIVFLQNNNITGSIPSELGKLPKLQTLDLSNNFFSAEIPPSLGHLRSLQFLRLNNNSLVGECPESLANMTKLTFLDLSYNNLSGPVPRILAKSFSIVGNPLLVCATGNEPNCHGMILMPISMNSNNTQDALSSGKPKNHKMARVSGLSHGRPIRRYCAKNYCTCYSNCSEFCRVLDEGYTHGKLTGQCMDPVLRHGCTCCEIV